MNRNNPPRRTTAQPKLRLVKPPKMNNMPGNYVGDCGALHCGTCWQIVRSSRRMVNSA